MLEDSTTNLDQKISMASEIANRRIESLKDNPHGMLQLAIKGTESTMATLQRRINSDNISEPVKTETQKILKIHEAVLLLLQNDHPSLDRNFISKVAYTQAFSEACME